MSKFNNKKITLDGRKFDSKKESERYLVLKNLEKQGFIKDLVCQPYWYLVNLNST